MTDWSRVRSRLLYAVCVLAIIVGPYLGWRWITAGRRFNERYRRIEIGMTCREVTALLGDDPDYSCEYGGGNVLYWSSGDLLAGKSSCPRSVEESKEIPYVYGYAQVLIDQNGRVAAFTINGEEVAVHTSEGDVPGSNFATLEEDFVNRLIAE